MIAFLLLFFGMSLNSNAASWLKLNENKTSKLSIDRQSIIEKDKFKRAWVKIEYKVPQKNIESPDKEYDLSKLLWYFDCAAQKSATSQVFQYLNAQLVYSAGIDVKNAEFIEPVPETDFDLAMRYVCKAPQAAKTKPIDKPDSSTDKPKDGVSENTEPSPQTTVVAAKENERNTKGIKDDAHWTYEGKEGPSHWGKLKSEFATCETGRNQSPINIDATIDAPLPRLKVIQKYPAIDIVNNGHTVQVNFKKGNSLDVDGTKFQMKQVHFHAPSENTIRGKSFPLEAHFVHADANGNLAVIGVMFQEGKPNTGLTKLWVKMPNDLNKPATLKAKVIADEMTPINRDYYRFNGSLTTPPCSEGVRWLLMKTPLTASKEQIEAFKLAVKHDNNRPVQPLNARIIVE